MTGAEAADRRADRPGLPPISPADIQSGVLGLAGVALVLTVTTVTWPLLEAVPYLLLVPVVAAVSWWGTRASALLTLAAAAAAAAFVLPHVFPPAGLLVFVAVGAFLQYLLGSRQRIDALRRSSDAEFRVSWDHSAMAAVLLDRHGLVERVNPAFESALGYAGAAWRGVWFGHFLHPDDEAAERERFTALMQGTEASYQHEQRYRRSDGTVIWGHVVVSALRAGPRTNGALMMLEDVTARRQAEEGLRVSEEKLRGLFEGLPVGLFQSTPTGKMLAVNPALVAMLGYDSADALQAVNARDIFADPGAHAALRTALEMGQEVSEQRVVLRRRPGGYLTARINARAVRHPSGVTWYDEVSVLDVTEHIALETELLQAQKRETLGRLVGGLAHDLNNLLTAISGWTEIALRSPGVPRDDLQEVLGASRRASALTRQLLAFSRRQSFQPEIIDVNDVVRGMEEQLQRLCGEQVKVLVDLAPDLMRTAADPGHVEQMLINLALNARDAMPKGGRLMIETANVALDNRYGFAKPARPKPGRYALLAVTDTGVGMDETVQAHLFEPFFTTKPAEEAAGLGLAMVYSIVKRLGGFVWVYSEVNRGTTVKIYFPPFGVSEGVEAAATSPAGAHPQGLKRVLVVEDDENVRRVACRVLRGHGYEVAEAANAEEARRLACEHDLDLLLTDVVLPGLDGPELAAELQATAPDLKTLFISGYTRRVMISTGVLPADAPFLEKPFTGSLLVETVRAMLDEASAGDGDRPGSLDISSR